MSLRSIVSGCGLLAASLTFAACGGTPSATPVRGFPAASGPSAGHSWMAPDAGTTALLYVADLNAGDVYVFSYPGAKLKGTLTGFQAVHYECVDAAGDVFIADTGASQVLEYARGGKKPIATFTTPGSTPNGCTINPVNGDLAVGTDPLGSGPGSVLVYRHATGKAKTYSTPNVFRVYFVGYDAKGNLFVDGTDMHVTFEFAELAKGTTAFQAVTLQQSINLPGAIQWDGQYLAVGDQVCIQCPSVINRFKIHGTTGTFISSVPLTDSCDVLQFWIQGKKVIAADDCGSTAKYFSYPSGGNSLKTIGNPLNEPVGVAVSLKGT